MRQNNYFSGKVVWITGGSSGIGEALAYQLAAAGAKIIISARREPELQRIGNHLPPHTEYFILPIDLNQPDILAEKVQTAVDKWGHIDIIINNAGVSQRSLGEVTTMQVERTIMETNYFAPILLTKLLLKHFRQQQSGHLVFMSSVSGKIGLPYRSAYSASKHAVEGFFGALRAELWGSGIKLIIVRAGAVRTSIAENALIADGSPFQQKDPLIAKGMFAEKTAGLILRGIQNQKSHLEIGSPREKLLFLLIRFIPSIAFKAIRGLKM
ncbi:MAG: SDR family oxidoreductase [Flavitalea sp.]